MPTYDYRCQKCGEDLEVYQSFSDKPLTKHDECGGKLVKVLSPAGIVLKGSGFYKTDSRGSSKTAAKEKTGDNGSGSSDTSSSNSSESKSDSSKSTGKNDGAPSTSKTTATEAKSA
jgi:putative FmdB family regulatory protein